MQVACLKCARPIVGDQLNVATNVAHCGSCGEVFALSELVDGSAAGVAQVDLNRPPAGVVYIPRMNGLELRVTTRSAAAWFMVPFMLVWSGGALGGIYGTQIYRGQFQLGQSLFGIPFLLGTLLFGSIALMTAVGRIVIRIDGDEGSAFAGVGPIGFTKRFDFYSVTAVREQQSNWGRDEGQKKPEIVLDGPKPVKLGNLLRDDRRRFVVAALRQLLKDRRRR